MTQSPISIKNIAAIVIGNALEWYDFIVYSFMTVFIADLFFPSSDPNLSLLAATATFGIGLWCVHWRHCARAYADIRAQSGNELGDWFDDVRFCIIACAYPLYASIGIAAPAFCYFARLLQGFSASGEFGSSTALLIGYHPPPYWLLYGSWQMFEANFCDHDCGGVGMLITHLLTMEQLHQWGWRLHLSLVCLLHR